MWVFQSQCVFCWHSCIPLTKLQNYQWGHLTPGSISYFHFQSFPHTKLNRILNVPETEKVDIKHNLPKIKHVGLLWNFSSRFTTRATLVDLKLYWGLWDWHWTLSISFRIVLPWDSTEPQTCEIPVVLVILCPALWRLLTAHHFWPSNGGCFSLHLEAMRLLILLILLKVTRWHSCDCLVAFRTFVGCSTGCSRDRRGRQSTVKV